MSERRVVKDAKVKTDAIPIINIQKEWDDARATVDQFRFLEIYSYLNPKNVPYVEARLSNHSIQKREVISDQNGDWYIKVFPEEILVIPVGVNLSIPYDYDLLIQPEKSLAFGSSMEIVNNTFYQYNDHNVILMRNYSSSVTNFYHNKLLLRCKLVNNYMFDIEEQKQEDQSEEGNK